MKYYKNKPESFWESKLSEDRYSVCRMKGTEKPFTGEYDKFFEDGIYYCASCGGDYALYDSTTKYDSKSGWPSFGAPIILKQVENWVLEYVQDFVILGLEKSCFFEEKQWLFLIRGSKKRMRSSGQVMLMFSKGKQSIT